MKTKDSTLSIRSVEAIPVVVPLLHPIKWARGEIKDIDNVIVVVTLSDGTQGIADAPPRPTIYGETQRSIATIIRDHFAPKLKNLDAFDIAGLWAVFDQYAGNPAAKSAIDMALFDAQAKHLGITCAELLGGTPKALPVNRRLMLGSNKEMLAEAERMIKRYGFKAWKVKCGIDKKRDIALLRALRKLVGDEHEITIDCNQGYSSQDLLETAPYFEEVNVALIEEPIPARDGAGKRFCAERTTIPISGDDSCMAPDDVLHELKLGGIRALVIKCARTGYTQSRQILALAKSFYTPVHNGTQADMQIGCVAAAHFASTYGTPHAHEFSSFIDAKDHVANEELVIKNGRLVLPPGPGIGLTLDPCKMKKYRVDL
ncbi:MAG: mandelate racemase/muconate lactonizing enzyme family protein [Burkholderiales bacterium]|nr:mandelate racemase/muconate lactonizing enzyme family protein [Burkholderiales bacterium]